VLQCKGGVSTVVLQLRPMGDLSRATSRQEEGGMRRQKTRKSERSRAAAPPRPSRGIDYYAYWITIMIEKNIRSRLIDYCYLI
jgi:hypothetical protein